LITKALWALVAISAIAAAAAVAMVAAAFALFALLAPHIGPAGAAAIVAGAAALVIALGALIATLKMRPPSRRAAVAEDTSLTTRAIALARQRPVLAAGVALAVGIIAFRNPRLVTALLTGVLAGKAAPKN